MNIVTPWQDFIVLWGNGRNLQFVEKLFPYDINCCITDYYLTPKIITIDFISNLF